MLALFILGVNDRWKDIVILETRSCAGIASAIGVL